MSEFQPLGPVTVANWFIEKSLAAGKTINVIKLQRLVFFAHGWSLAILDAPLVNEQPEAWEWAPVFPSLYSSAIEHGSQNIFRLLDIQRPGYLWICFSHDHPTLPLLEKIWTVYGGLTAEQLCRLANEHEGPWAQTLKKNPGVVRPDIPNEALKEYFKKQQEANAANSSQAC